MELLAGTLYDPAVAVSKSCAALLAMTAFDTTNLRLTFTAPASGIVRVRVAVACSYAANLPAPLLGVLEGSAVLGRVSPRTYSQGAAAQVPIPVFEADFLVAGLVAGSHTFDAAYGVEATTGGSNLKYGGPDNTSAGDAWGGFAFEVWDPVGSGGGGGGLTESDVRDAVGLAAANLDTQLAGLLSEVDTLLARVRRLTAHGDGKAHVSQNPK